MTEVALLGTGRMGAAIARRLASAGHSVAVWNRTAATAHALAESLASHPVTVAPSAAECVRDRAVVLCTFADGSATRSVLLNAPVMSNLQLGATVCDLGTTGVDIARELATSLRRVGVRFLDAPVSGSIPAVQAGTLLVMAGGDADAIDAVRPVLAAVANRIVRVGEPGAGQAMKLAVNLVVHDLNAALAEALILAERAGITRESAYGVLEQSVVAAPFVTYKRAAFLDPATPVAMSLDLVAKDLRLITDLARQLAAATPVTDAAERVVDMARHAGLGPRDMADLSRFGPDRRV